MSEEKKKVKWADIERIHNAFTELLHALYDADEPRGIVFSVIELVKQAKEEAGGALLFAEFEDGEGNPWISKECLEKLKLEWLEKKLDHNHNYCNYCFNSGLCGKGVIGKMQKEECEMVCEAVRRRLGLSEGTFNKAMTDIAKENCKKEMRGFWGNINKEATK